jgi:hypothetical protein
MENLPYVVFQKRQLADIESSVEEFSRVKKKRESNRNFSHKITPRIIHASM